MYISLTAAPGGTEVFNKENQRGAIPSTLAKTWRFFIRLIYDMTVIWSILMVWCDQLILLFVRTRLDWLFWQNDAGGWYHNRVGINLRYYLSNRLIRNWWQNTIQKWIWRGVSLTYFHSIYWNCLLHSWYFDYITENWESFGSGNQFESWWQI